jgi:hypothetical protein
MRFRAKTRILKKAHKLINSVACGSKPAARRKPHLDVWFTLRKPLLLNKIYKI